MAGGSANWVLEPEEAGQPRVVLAGYAGRPLPATLHGIELSRETGAGSRERWRLRCQEGEFGFEVRGIERLEPLPGLFDPLLAGHALRARDRLWIGMLLKLLRLPGGAWLLRTWHASRS